VVAQSVVRHYNDSYPFSSDYFTILYFILRKSGAKEPITYERGRGNKSDRKWKKEKQKDENEQLRGNKRNEDNKENVEDKTEKIHDYKN
jgi:hypothetical protein